MNVSRPHIYKGPAELHGPLQVVPEEVIGTTHRSRDCSVWESDALLRDTSQHCTGRSPLPKGWAVLAVGVWLKTRTAGDAGWGGLPAVKDYCAYMLWCTFCANCYLGGATQSVTAWLCVCSHPHFCKARFCSGVAPIKGGFHSPERPVLAWETQQELY